MGKRSRRRRSKHRRRRKNERKSKALARVEGQGVQRLRIDVEQLEIAKGHDGLLRGAPEPTMLLGVYRVQAGHARLFGRFIYRFERPGDMPCKVDPRERSDEQVLIPSGSDTEFVLLALAIEEDSGRGLRSVFAKLERAQAAVVWTHDGPTPEPVHLSELKAAAIERGVPSRVHLMFDDQEIGPGLRGDDWVDACVVWMGSEGKARHRLHFAAADGRNDWTAVVMVGVGRA